MDTDIDGVEAMNEPDMDTFWSTIQIEQHDDETIPTTIREKGKRPIYEEVLLVDVDDSCDSEYRPETQSSQSSDDGDELDSDAASDALEDVEGSSDDDIFQVKNLSRKQLEEKLKHMIRKIKKKGLEQVQFEQPHVIRSEEWYSDPGEEDELLSMSESDDEAPKHPVYKDGEDMKRFEMSEGLKFSDAKQYREVLRDWSVRQGFELVFLRNERTRVTAKCKNDGCTFRIHASPIMGGPVFQVKTIKGKHVCPRKNTNNLAHAKYIAKRIENIIRETPNIRISKLQNSIKKKLNIEVGKWKALRAKRYAMEAIRGKEGMQYYSLWDYCETLRKNNPGSTLLLKKVENSNPPIFERMYFCLDAMKKGFLSGCRPLIGLDGCFLKTIHGGQLLVAISKDGNDNMWPIAMAVVAIENRENWTWFIEKLLEDIGGLGRNWWTFISDRQKGLVEALKELVPDCEHRYCCRHIFDNFQKKFKLPKLKEHFWKAAGTANKKDFEACMNEIEKLDPKIKPEKETAVEWLRKIPPQHWSRAFFSSHSKSDILVNNICESFNSYILEARDQPIISMWEWIRERLMTRIQTKREGMEKYTGIICPNILKKINKHQLLLRTCNARWCGKNEFEVQQNLNKYVVDLEKKTCTCGIFQLSRIPCYHAHAAIGHKRANIEDFLDECYKKPAYMKVYENMIHGVPGVNHYITTGIEPLGPPKFQTKIGRPKKLRRRGPGENERNKSTRKGHTHKCTKCLKEGHNRGSCRNPPHPQSKQYKRKPARKGKTRSKQECAITVGSLQVRVSVESSVTGVVESAQAPFDCSQNTV